MNVAIYLRVSTVRQAENELSLPDQKAQLEAWCREHGHKIVAIYTDAGRSATDSGKRPEFNRMIEAALTSPPPFKVIVVHSLSRFYRDQTELMWHVKQMRRNGVALYSVTQCTTEDSTGEMIMRLIAMFDEYSSKENAKHVIRTMLKNAQEGYFNGSRVPFGYKTVEQPVKGAKGRNRKKLEVEPTEAELVKRVFNLYATTNKGIKDIVSLLNQEGTLRRGKPWSIATMHKMLTSTVYIGRKLFNQQEWKSRAKKSAEEVVVINVPAIIEDVQFVLTAKRLKSRSPKIVHPRTITSTHLLTGMLKCGECGASMVMATGKNNQYYYYRCTTKTKHGTKMCSSKAIRMDKLETLVLDTLAQQVLTPERVMVIIRELKKEVGKKGGDSLPELQKQLDVLDYKVNNLYDAIANGTLSVNDHGLMRKMEAFREERVQVAAKIEGAERSEAVMISRIDKTQVNAFTGMVQRKLMDRASKFPKDYLRLLVHEVVLTGNTVRLIGDSTSLASMVKVAAESKKLSTPEGVLSFSKDWRAWRDSNSRPTDS